MLLEDENIITLMKESALLNFNTSKETGFSIFNTEKFGRISSKIIEGEERRIELPHKQELQYDVWDYKHSTYQHFDLPDNFEFAAFNNRYKINEVLFLHYHNHYSEAKGLIVPSSLGKGLFLDTGDIECCIHNHQENPALYLIGKVYSLNPLQIAYLAYQKKANSEWDIRSLNKRMKEYYVSFDDTSQSYNEGNHEITKILNESGFLTSSILLFEGGKLKYDSQDFKQFSFEAWNDLSQ